MPTDEPAESPPPRGPEVARADVLLRAVSPRAAPTWIKDGKPTSAAFSFPQFSADVLRLTTLPAFLSRWEAGTAAVAFPAGEARDLGFDARLESELGNDAHANVYCDHPTGERKRCARKLAENFCSLLPPPAAP